MFRLALVTGASSGIGESLCHLLAGKGIPLLITGRNESALNQLAEELRHQVEVEVVVVDLQAIEGRALIVNKIHERTPDLVINNAGLGYYGPATKVSTEDQLEIVEVNVTALTELTVEAAKALLQEKLPGVILNVSSVASFFPFPNNSVYGASKAYVNSFSQAIDSELKEKGIRVLTACPGMVETNFSSRAAKGKKVPTTQKKMSPDFAAEVIWKNIQKRNNLFIFNWPYKIAAFFIHYLIPTPVLTYFLKGIFSSKKSKKIG